MRTETAAAAASSGSLSAAPLPRAPGPLAVCGASGHLGRLVLHELLDALHVPPSELVAITRAPQKLAAFSARGVHVRAGDYGSRESLLSAFAGCARALVISTEVHYALERRTELHLRAMQCAADAGVRHLLYTSMQTPLGDAPEEQCLERLWRERGVSHTTLGFNFWSETVVDWHREAIATGVLYTSSATGSAAHVSRADCARAAAAALAFDTRAVASNPDASSPNAKFEISGPETLSRADVAEQLSKAFLRDGRPPIRVQELSMDALRAHYSKLSDAHLPEEFLAHLSPHRAEGDSSSAPSASASGSPPTYRADVRTFFPVFMAEFDAIFARNTLAPVRDGFARLVGGRQPEAFAACIARLDLPSTSTSA